MSIIEYSMTVIVSELRKVEESGTKQRYMEDTTTDGVLMILWDL